MIKLIAAFGLLTLMATSAGAVTIIGMGNDKCSDWVSAAADGGSPGGSYEQWVAAFMSGLAVGDKIDFLKKTNLEGIINVVTEGCKLKPDNSIAEAVLAIVAKMEK